ncbi:MAG: hypothetical protein M0018_04415 [Nitrospiraceae bacterium]|nr:hypothetical protein [Nitrospiraceae bacterium]
MATSHLIIVTRRWPEMKAPALKKAGQKMDLRASALSETGRRLRSGDAGRQVSGYPLKVSDSMEQASDYLRETATDALHEAAPGQKKSRPVLLLGSALITVYIALLLLKTSRSPY